MALAVWLASAYVARRVSNPEQAVPVQSPDGPPAVETGSETDQSTPRLLYAQIVDDEPKDVFVERAILEGKPFKYLLKRAAAKTCAELIAATDEKLMFEYLSDEPGLHRGAAYTPGRGVVLEVSRVELDPSYGFPPGWSVLPAVYVNTAKEVYALRFICPPSSTLYDRLKKGITDDELPVINLSGLFFKNYARKTGNPKEPPWVRPLLVCPEPQFPANVEPRHVLKELDEAGFGNLLPSQRIDAPGAEERLVLDVTISKDAAVMKAFGSTESTDPKGFIPEAIERLKTRLPPDQALHPSIVILWHGTQPNITPTQKKILVPDRFSGVERVFFKYVVIK
jgi:hypothetical protein